MNELARHDAVGARSVHSRDAAMYVYTYEFALTQHAVHRISCCRKIVALIRG